MTNNSEIFRELHYQPRPLILANAWDAASARVVERLGASAVATTSAGVSWALGYPDGTMLPLQKLMSVIENIVRVIRIPLTVDIEGGYVSDPLSIGEIIKPLLDVGVVGVNIEDGQDNPKVLARKIENVKKVALSRGVNLFVNARTDVYLQGLVPEDQRVEETIARGLLYKEAGADGFFVPALVESNVTSQIVKRVELPLNVLASPGLAPINELAKLGVRRLSAGSSISQVILGRVEHLAKHFLESGKSEPLSEGALDYTQLQTFFPD